MPPRTPQVRELAKAGAAADLAALAQAKRSHLVSRGEMGQDDPPPAVEAWNTSFYHERVLRQEHGVDTEAVTPTPTLSSPNPNPNPDPSSALNPNPNPD